MKVAAEHAGWRADRALTALVPGINRRGMKELFRGRQIRLNGKIASGAERVVTGDTFTLPDLSHDAVKKIVQKSTEPRLTTAHGRHLSRLYEDESLLVISKPPEIPVHHGQGGYLRRDTLEDVMNSAYPPPPGVSSRQGYYFVHRLDMETSGCLLIARNEAVRDALIKDFSERKIHKEYLAIAAGSVKWDTLLVKKPITYIKAEEFAELPRTRRKDRKPILRGVKKGIALSEGDPKGKASETRFKVLKRYNGYTLIHASPRTGRTHQIRVHLSSTGHPLAYDPLYGRHSPIRLREFYPRAGLTDEGDEIVLNRLPLHAWKLGFKHPVTGLEMKFEAPVPRDLREFMRVLKKYRNLGRD